MDITSISLFFTLFSALSIWGCYKKFPKFTYKFALYTAFILISIQGFFIHSIDSISLLMTNVNVDFLSVEAFILDLALATIIYLGFVFSHFDEQSIDDKLKFFFAGSLQIGTLITFSSLDIISINIKVISNTLYVLLPAFVLFEVQNKYLVKKEKKTNDPKIPNGRSL